MTRISTAAGLVSQQKKTANQALIHQLICYSESRAKSMSDLTAKSIENLLNNHVEITQCIYQLIFLRINCSIHCKIHKKSLRDFAHDFSIVNLV